MDQIQIIFVNETYQNDQVQVKFLVNSIEVLPNLEYRLSENNPEYYSQTLYEHLLNHIPQMCSFLVFVWFHSLFSQIEPLNCIQKQRWKFTSQLCVDLILKLLNLKYIPIIQTNYSLYPTEPIDLGDQSIISKLNMNWQQMCLKQSRISKELITIMDDFKFLYRIQILHCSTFQPLKKEKYPSMEVFYVPTDELIFLKTKENYSVSTCLQLIQQLVRQ